MTMYYLFILLLGLVSGSQIGKSYPEEKNEHISVHIINGNNAPITKYPYMVSIMINGALFGSGVILNKNWILTTAFNVAWCDTSDLQFRVGSNNYNQGGTILSANKVIVHENYTFNSWDYNIAVIEVTKPMKFGKKVKNIKLGTKELKNGTKAVVSGWGEKTDPGVPSNILLEVDVTVLDWDTCYQNYTEEITTRLMCTFDTTDGPCYYDYGDPLTVGKAVYGLYTGGHSCIPGTTPQLYTDIPSLYQWVKNAIKNRDQEQLF